MKEAGREWSVETNTYSGIFYVENRKQLIAASFSSKFIRNAKEQAEQWCEKLNREER